MNVEQQCGLIASNGAVPLEGVRIDARLAGACVEVTVTQRYRNREAVPIEAVYVFPLDEGAAVCGFAALVSGKLIRGQVCEREKAFEQYDDALIKGDGAFLLDQERPNIFTASVGGLRPNEVVEVQIRYVALLPREGDALRLTIPTTVSPRYVPKGPAEVGQPDGERVNPEHWPSVPYGLELTVGIDGAGLRRIESPSHAVRTTLNDEGAKVELACENAALDRDFVLLVERSEPRRAEAKIARDADGRRFAMLTFLPDVAKTSEQGHEVLFLLDCSGSMEGESITQARRALSLCVRALRTEDTFNVVRFGSSHKSLWKTPHAFDDASLEKATKYIEGSSANLGGTEILEPLTALLGAKQDEKRPRRVLILTDGQVSNEHEVLALARKHADTARIFAFGIGAGASEHLVRGTARVSRGAAEMIFPGERIEPKVLRMFERVRMPVLDDARIDWKGLRVEQAPGRVPPVFAGEALTVFARIESGTASEVELVLGDERFSVAIDLERAAANGPIPVLWAREAIRELDDETPGRGSAQRRPEADARRRARLVELGSRYGLLSSATSYVAVEERTDAERVQSPVELRRIPVALTTGWGGSNARTGFGSGPVAAGVMHAYAPAILSGMPSAGPAAPARFFAIASAGQPGESGRRGMQDLSSSGEGEIDEPMLVSDMAESQQSGAQAEADRLYDVLMTQRADGSFVSSAALAAWLGEERAGRLAQAVAEHGEHMAVTSTVILLLEREESRREAEWRPAVNKAKAWLLKQAAAFDASDVLG